MHFFIETQHVEIKKEKYVCDGARHSEYGSNNSTKSGVRIWLVLSMLTKYVHKFK